MSVDPSSSDQETQLLTTKLQSIRTQLQHFANYVPSSSFEKADNKASVEALMREAGPLLAQLDKNDPMFKLIEEAIQQAKSSVVMSETLEPSTKTPLSGATPELAPEKELDPLAPETSLPEDTKSKAVEDTAYGEIARAAEELSQKEAHRKTSAQNYQQKFGEETEEVKQKRAARKAKDSAKHYMDDPHFAAEDETLGLENLFDETAPSLSPSKSNAADRKRQERQEKKNTPHYLDNAAMLTNDGTLGLGGLYEEAAPAKSKNKGPAAPLINAMESQGVAVKESGRATDIAPPPNTPGQGQSKSSGQQM